MLVFGLLQSVPSTFESTRLKLVISIVYVHFDVIIRILLPEVSTKGAVFTDLVNNYTS